jgi:hypothetical protein
MKNLITGLTVILAFASIGCSQREFYVSPQGSDRNEGTIDAPFATIDRAKEAVRKALEQTDEDITVYLRGGMYQLKESVVFGPQDGGKDNQRVIYRNYKGEEPVISAGVRVNGWKKLDVKPDGLPEKAFGKVYVAEIPEGIDKFYCLYDGFYRLPRARGEGFTPVQDANDPNRSTTQLHYPKDALIKNWENITDVEISIRPWCLWAMNILPLERVDDKNRVAYTAVEGSYPLTRERYERFGDKSVWVENVLEALDSPGEWVVNTKTRRIYLWPAGDIAETEIYVPVLTELFAVKGDEKAQTPVTNMSFKGLNFVHTDRDTWSNDDKGLQHDWEMYDDPNAMLRLRWAQGCEVDGCGFIGGGSGGVRLDLYCQQITVKNCEIARLGGTGILLCGYGPGKKDFNKNNLILNNHIHHIGRLYWQNAAIMVWQSGSNRIANNYIHNVPYNAVAFSGASLMTFRAGMEGRFGKRELERTIQVEDCAELFNSDKPLTWPRVMPYLHTRDNVFEFNEVHHCIETLGDGNAVYIRMCPGGNIVRQNYFHDIYGSPNTVTSVLRADDAQAGCEFVENIIYRCVGGGINSKAGNLIKNNIIIDIFTEDCPLNVYKVQPKGYITSQPSSTGYADTDYIWHDKTVATHNVLYSNSPGEPVFYNSINKNWPAEYKEKMSAVYNAPYVDKNVIFWANDTNGQYVKEVMLKMRKERRDELNSVPADPGFVAPDKGDFRFRPGSPCLKLGIKGLKTEDMGLSEPLDERFERYEKQAKKIPFYPIVEEVQTAKKSETIQKGFGHD